MTRRSLLAAALVVLVVSAGAPGIFLWAQLQALAERGQATAEQVASLLMQDARPHPVLWRYDTLKLGARLHAYRGQVAVELVEVTDSAGRWVESGAPRPDPDSGGALLWRSAPMTVDAHEVGRVWVALDIEESRWQALGLTALFGLIGAAMVALMNWAQMETDARKRLVLKQSRRALEHQEAERRAIARDLHDVTGQALTALRIDLELLKTTDSEAERQRVLSRAVCTTDDAVDDVRRTLQRLRAAVLDEVGLQEALVRLGQAFAERHRVLVSVNVSLADVVLPQTLELGCYRVCQEALTNVARHAQATAVHLNVGVEGDLLSLSIVDDGCGFDPATARGGGLGGVRERIALLEGRLELDSAPGGGTRLRAWLPVHAEEATRSPSPSAIT